MLSIRANIEMSQTGIGVSAGARKYLRRADVKFAEMSNQELTEFIAHDFARSKPWHRFRLNRTFQGIAEVRKSGNFAYIAMVRGRGTHEAGYDILFVQPAIKEPKEEIRLKRLEPGWGLE